MLRQSTKVILIQTGEDYRNRDLLDQTARLIEIFGVDGASRERAPESQVRSRLRAGGRGPPTGLPSRPTCRGAGPLQVLKTQDSRATPG
jgi:hypothetical protein